MKQFHSWPAGYNSIWILAILKMFNIDKYLKFNLAIDQIMVQVRHLTQPPGLALVIKTTLFLIIYTIKIWAVCLFTNSTNLTGIAGKQTVSVHTPG